MFLNTTHISSGIKNRFSRAADTGKWQIGTCIKDGRPNPHHAPIVGAGHVSCYMRFGTTLTQMHSGTNQEHLSRMSFTNRDNFGYFCEKLVTKGRSDTRSPQARI